MKSLSYLFLTNLKNSIKQLVKHPAKLIAVLFFVAIMVMVVITSGFNTETEFRDIRELYAMILALYGTMYIMGCMNGLHSGASFYSMADVNLLFASPISSKKILIYGLLRQLQVSCLVGLFLIFQYGWLNNTYNLSFGGMAAIFLGYCLTVFCSSLTAMFIYSMTSSSENKKRAVRYGIYLIVLLLAVYLLTAAFSDRQNILGGLVTAVNAPWTSYLPVFGWLQMGVVGIISSNFIGIAAGFGLVILFVAAVLLLITGTHADFYEDVLKATEVSYSAITARKEGKVQDTPMNVKVGKTGIGKGWGPSVFFHKHMLENRRNRLFILDRTSLIFAVTCIGFAFFMRESGILPIFIFSVYMQVFSTAMGRWTRELLLPYVYLLPQSPFKKLVNICKEVLYKACVEAVVIFIPVGIILQSSIPEILSCIVARIGFGILFVAGNILIERVLGSLTNKVFIMFFYFIMIILIAVPGVVLGVMVSILIPGALGVSVGLLCTFGWNLLLSGLIAFLCRDILNYAELNNL